MIYDYKIYNYIYDLIVSGQKKLEIRLLNDKSKSIKSKDLIRFTNIEDENKKVIVKVKDKRIYDNINILLESEDDTKIYPNKEKIKEILTKTFGNNNEKFIVIEFELMEE